MARRNTHSIIIRYTTVQVRLPTYTRTIARFCTSIQRHRRIHAQATPEHYGNTVVDWRLSDPVTSGDTAAPSFLCMADTDCAGLLCNTDCAGLLSIGVPYCATHFLVTAVLDTNTGHLSWPRATASRRHPKPEYLARNVSPIYASKFRADPILFGKAPG